MYVNDMFIPDFVESVPINYDYKPKDFTMDIVPFWKIEQASKYLINNVNIFNPSNYPKKLIFNGTTTIAIWGNDYPTTKTVAKCSEPCGLVSTGVKICIIRRIFKRNVLNRLRHKNPNNWIDAAWDIVYATNVLDQKKYNTWIDRVVNIYNLVANYKDSIGEDVKIDIVIEFSPDGKVLDYSHYKDIKHRNKID